MYLSYLFGQFGPMNAMRMGNVQMPAVSSAQTNGNANMTNGGGHSSASSNNNDQDTSPG
jgi:hypothetical protein